MPFLASADESYTSAIILLYLLGLRLNRFFVYSFYSFPYSLHFRVKRNHWYQLKSVSTAARGTRDGPSLPFRPTT